MATTETWVLDGTSLTSGNFDVMDPNVPLDAYTPRIEAYRAAGMPRSLPGPDTGCPAIRT